ncbi:Pycsar system effector family protein [Streptosporangium saharense]|uniref:Pycsar system effector family protein n=1 Tax=Streptosporangium saharense TaxID=1706840 RepID=UPI003318E823
MGDDGTVDARTRAMTILAETREEVNRADTKASILLGAIGIAVSGVVGDMVNGVVSGAWGASWPWLRWTAAGAAFLSVTLLLMALYPRRIRLRRPLVNAYFGDVVAHSDPRALRAALERPSPDELGRLTDQIHTISRIVSTKYRLIQLALWCLAISVLSGVLTVAAAML